MRSEAFDLVLLGGGLSAGMLAQCLGALRPNVTVAICDTRSDFDSAKTWSFQSLNRASDPTPCKSFTNPLASWLKDLISKTWNSYQVLFPGFEQHVQHAYHSVRGEDFYRNLSKQKNVKFFLGVTPKASERSVLLPELDLELTTPCVLSATGWPPQSGAIQGYQKFFGIFVTTTKPHTITEPVIMDACVDQSHGYRFIYTLPWSESSLLIEDTYYSLSTEIDQGKITEELMSYARLKNILVDQCTATESGCLPIPLLDSSAPASTSLIPAIGASGGFFHATTGYSFYEAATTAETIALLPALTTERARSALDALHKHVSQHNRFNRRLNNMLFLAAKPEDRIRVFERFYRLPTGTIERFYANRLRPLDKVLLLSGRPPVPLFKGLYHFFRKTGRPQDVAHC